MKYLSYCETTKKFKAHVIVKLNCYHFQKFYNSLILSLAQKYKLRSGIYNKSKLKIFKITSLHRREFQMRYNLCQGNT